jgi:uncharacterized protein YndB with AHSA1/START domain
MTETDYGELRRDDGTPRLRFTRRLPFPQAAVWRAVTEPEHLAAWFPTTIDGERRAGAPLRFRHRDDAGPAFDGEMLAFDPPSVMELRWGEDIVRIEVEPAGEAASTLVLTHTFADLGKAARDGAGWHVCLDALGRSLSGDPTPDGTRERWEEVRADYAERFGPEAAIVGPPGE